jgi:hypothetical protein
MALRNKAAISKKYLQMKCNRRGMAGLRESVYISVRQRKNVPTSFHQILKCSLILAIFSKP